MNVSELLRKSAERAPSKRALAYGQIGVEAELTYRDLDREADRVARGLRAAGVERGDRVAIAMPNIPHFAFAYFGALRADAVAVPMNSMLTASEMSRVLKDAGARVLLCAGAPGETAASAARDAKTERVISIEEWDSLGELDGPSLSPVTGDDDIAVLAYTSGTTGQAKGAMLTHRNLLANLDQQMEIPDAHVTEDDVLFLALPLFHIFGLNVTLGLMTRNAATGILLERFEPVAALRAIQEHKVSVLFGAPPMYVAWVDTPGSDQYDLSSVRLAVSGAAPLMEETLHRFKTIFGVDIHEGYGLTETAPTLTSNRMAEVPRPGSVGMPLPGIEIRLIDPEGNDVEPGDPGELVVRGDNVFKGYWQRGDETERAFIDGWFRTGDIAVRDEDGYIYLVDRKRDLIIVSGFNVFPSEVEDAILEHPKVHSAAVIGIPHTYTGEAVKAYVVVADGESLNESDLNDFLHERLARFKTPESIEFVAELPRLLTGKVLRRALRT